jgi:membrane protein required for colicin V production
VLQSTGNWLMTMLPDDPETTILKRLKRDKDEQTDLSPERPPNATVATDTGGYSKTQRDGLRQLIEGKSMTGR